MATHQTLPTELRAKIFLDALLTSKGIRYYDSTTMNEIKISELPEPTYLRDFCSASRWDRHYKDDGRRYTELERTTRALIAVNCQFRNEMSWTIKAAL